MFKKFRQIQIYICLALLAALIFTPTLQIVMRGVFDVPMAGGEELARYFLICLTLIGGGFVTSQGGQIKMEEIQAMLPDRLRWYLQLLIDFCGVGMFGFIAYASIRSILNNLENQTATLEMPFWIFMMPLTLGMIFLCIELMVELANTWKNQRANEKQTTLT